VWKTSAPDASSVSLLCALFSRHAVLDSIAQAPDTTLRYSTHVHCKHTHQTALQKCCISAADALMSISIQYRLSLETKITIQEENAKDLMATDEGQGSSFHVTFCRCTLCTFWSMCLWFVPAIEYSQSSLYQCHGGCGANERGLSLEQEGLGCAIHSAYLNAL